MIDFIFYFVIGEVTDVTKTATAYTSDWKEKENLKKLIR